MNTHNTYLDWIHLVNKGIRQAEFKLLSNTEIARLRQYESSYIQRAKIWNEGGKTHIRLLFSKIV